MVRMRHGKKAESFAYLSLLLRGYAVLFRELRRAFGRRLRLDRRSATFGRLSLVNSYLKSRLASQSLPCRELGKVGTSPVLGRSVRHSVCFDDATAWANAKQYTDPLPNT
jgi:hypothetical protein